MKIPLLDLKAQFAQVEKDVRAAIDRVLASQTFILGPEVESMETKLAAYTHCKFAIGVSSGTDALVLSLMALDIKAGDEIITTPYTFFATAGSIARLGAVPVFVDIDPKSFNIDASLIEAKITPKTKGIMPVHLFGQCADMNTIMEISKKHGIPVIEDAAQAIGTQYQGKSAGSMGAVGCFSFFPSKNLGTLGDGGLVTANDAALAEKLKILRAHGSKPKYYHKFIGGNFRIDALHAAVVAAKLPLLDKWSDGRKRNAHLYNELFTTLDKNKSITLPWQRSGDRHIFNQYVIRTPKRDLLKQKLTEAGIGNEVYYPVPMHLQECFAYLGHKSGAFPHSEKAALESLAIPVYPEMTPDQLEYVAKKVVEFVS